MEWTGLPFVFAVWTGRPDLPSSVIEDLRRAALDGIWSIRDTYLPGEGASDGVDDRTYLTRYIRYALGDAELMGLRRFAALGQQMDLVGTRDVVLYGSSKRVRSRMDVDTLLARAADGERLTEEQAIAIAENAKVADLGAAADLRRRALHKGNLVRYTLARAIDARTAAGRASDSTLQWASKLSEGVALGISEVWLTHAEAVESPKLLDVLTQFLGNRYKLGVRALTVAGLADACQRWGLKPESVARHLKADGVAALIPGGWPLLDEGRGWLPVVEAVHEAGLHTDAVLPIGSGEGWDQRVRHLIRLRQLQDRTQGFTAFRCAVQGGRPAQDGGTATDYAATLAVARLVLDNVRQVVAAPGSLGTAQTALHLGADGVEAVCIDAEQTTIEGEPVHDWLESLEETLKAAGFEPVRVRR